MTSPNQLRWAIRGFGCLILALLAFVAAGQFGGGEDEAARVVSSYVHARREGDAAKACAQLSKRQQRELVARIARVSVAEASSSDCHSYVLEHSAASNLTRPALATFRVAGVETRSVAASVRIASPPGFRLPLLRLAENGGEWKLDGNR